MADLQYFNYKNYGTYALENFAYNQAVRVGDKIELSGQGRCHPHPSSSDINLIETGL